MNPRTDSPPSRELDDLGLARAQRGDADAFGALVRHYHRVVWSYLWRMHRWREGRRFESFTAERDESAGQPTTKVEFDIDGINHASWTTSVAASCSPSTSSRSPKTPRS